jgi:DNA-directed RNA polymerases I, II, and III subunit RPABC1
MSAASFNIGSSILTKIYKSRKNILEQLNQRGYDISNYDNFSIHELHIMIQNKELDMIVQNSKSQKVFIKYYLAKKLTPNYIYSLINSMVDEVQDSDEQLNIKTDEIIFIIKEEPNDTLKKLVEQIYNTEKIFINIFNIKRLQFNILKHSLVPEHIILDEEDILKLREKYNIINEKVQLPSISRFDPVAMAIGMRPGNICKIIRPSRTAIKAEYYRYCV